VLITARRAMITTTMMVRDIVRHPPPTFGERTIIPARKKAGRMRCGRHRLTWKGRRLSVTRILPGKPESAQNLDGNRLEGSLPRPRPKARPLRLVGQEGIVAPAQQFWLTWAYLPFV
jgi:hypothetical protein